MKCEILDKKSNPLLTCLQIFVPYVSKPTLIFKLASNSFLLLLFLMNLLSIQSKRIHQKFKSAFAFKKLFENHQKSVFPTYPNYSRMMYE